MVKKMPTSAIVISLFFALVIISTLAAQSYSRRDEIASADGVSTKQKSNSRNTP